MDISVASMRHSNRARFELGLSRITVTDERSALLANAYRALSQGLQFDNTQSSAGLSVKIGSLLNAARVFGQFGMQEMRLWSYYFAAHLAQYQLKDFNTTLDFVAEILSAAEGTRFRKLNSPACSCVPRL